MQNKNVLQEFFQKRYLSLPQYNTICVGTINNQQEWRSEVILYNGTKYVGKIATTKKVAESLAAEEALFHLENKVFKKRVAILIDVENLHNFHKSIPDEDYDKFDVYIFVGKHHFSVDYVFHEKAIKIVSPSTRPDGTDTCMQVSVGSFLTQELYDTYFIATADRFGENLVEMITCNNLGWLSKKACVVIKYQQICDHEYYKGLK